MAFKFLIILAIIGAAEAQTWPSAAFPNLSASYFVPQTGRIEFATDGASLRDGPWTDMRGKLAVHLALSEELNFCISSSYRNLKAYGAFQRGLEDTRLGLTYRRRVAPVFALGASGYFLAPTGYRKRETYYDDSLRATLLLPAFSLGQTGGELYGSAVWTPGEAVEIGATAGYFSSADRTEQALRWGLRAFFAPFGPRVSAELAYAQSLVRRGTFPRTDVVAAAIPLRLGWGFSLLPGVCADLGERTLFGGSLGLRFSAPLHGAQPPMAPEPQRRFGTVLVPPPLILRHSADGGELWQNIRSGAEEAFESAEPLASLDLPGFPYNDTDPVLREHSIRALAEANPAAQWLLVTQLEQESVKPRGGLHVPFLFARPAWTAQCRLRVRLVNLRDRTDGDLEYVIEGKAVQRQSPLLPVASPPESEVLSLNAGRELTFEAYRAAAREIARELRRAR